MQTQTQADIHLSTVGHRSFTRPVKLSSQKRKLRKKLQLISSQGKLSTDRKKTHKIKEKF